MLYRLFDNLMAFLFGNEEQQPVNILKPEKYAFKYVDKKRTFLLNNVIAKSL